MRAPTFVLVPLALLASIAPARASETYPDRIAQTYATECAPACTLCHLTAKGGAGTARTPFGSSIRAAGLPGRAPLETLDMAMLYMQTNKINSDSEPTPDIEELIAGLDPNVAGAELCTGPKYGCGAATVARRPRGNAAEPAVAFAAMLTLLAGALFLRRQR